MTTFTLNQEHNGIEIIFDSKPNFETRAALKENGFRWHRKKALWYAKQNPERIELAKSLVNGEDIKPSELVTGGEISEGYMGATRWDGYKSHKSLYGAELSKAIRQDIKAHGIKGATVRVHEYSGGQSIRVTVKAKESDFIPFEEWKKGRRIFDFATCHGTWLIENDVTYKQITVDEYLTLDETEQDRIFEVNAKHAYYSERRSQAVQYTDGYSTFTDELKAKIDKINSIVLTFRYDDSNGMVDYFNTNFYYNIELKMIEG